VFEGEIAFANEAGSLTVAGGEAATARPGQAPTRAVLVNRVGREQMLYYLSRDEGLAMLAHTRAGPRPTAAWFDAAERRNRRRASASIEADPDSWAGRPSCSPGRAISTRPHAQPTRGLRAHPDSSALYEVRTRVALLQGDGKLAEQTVATWLGHQPDDGAAYAMRAEIAFAYLGEPYSALADAERAVEDDPSRPASFATLAEIRLERDAPREALRAIDRAIALTPDDAGLHARRALILLERNRVRAAKRAVERAMELDPSLSIVRAALARYHVQTGHSDRALDELLAASAGNPAYAPPLIALAEVYYRDGQDEVAQQQLDAADRLDPANPQTPLPARPSRSTATPPTMRSPRARGDAALPRARRGLQQPVGEPHDRELRLRGVPLPRPRGWGRYYGDRVFDSFVPSAYFDQALNQTPSPFILAPRDYYSDRVFRPFETQSGEDLDSVSSFVQGCCSTR
jgi:tetratricopeptide (TPR) repeat protein